MVVTKLSGENDKIVKQVEASKTNAPLAINDVFDETLERDK